MPEQKNKNQLVWNLQNPRTFHWTKDLLPALEKEGLQFQAVGVDVWLEKLKTYSEQTSDEEALRFNPAVKLLDFYQKTYGHHSSKENGHFNSSNGTGRQEVRFDTKVAERDSINLRDTPDVLRSGLIAKTLQHWLKTWPSA